MRLVLNYFVTLLFGIIISLGISKLIGILFPTIEMWVFLFLSVSWLFIGWRYSKARSQINQLKMPDGCNLFIARDEIIGFIDLTNKEAEKNGGQNYFHPELANA